MKKIFYIEKHLKIVQTCQKLSTILEISKSKKVKEIKDKTLLLKSKKTICSNNKSTNELEKHYSIILSRFKFSMFRSLLFIIICCSFLTKLICWSNRCCFWKTFFNSTFNFFCLFSKRRQRIVFIETKLHDTVARIHLMHLFESLSIRQTFEK